MRVLDLTLLLTLIRRRVWTPLCAPRSVLDELGAERVKGLGSCWG